MSKLYIAIFTGICFGSWPLIMNKSGLDGRFSPVVQTTTILFMTLFTITFTKSYETIQFTTKSLVISTIAGFVAGIGVLNFNKMISFNSLKDLSNLFVIVTLIQVSIPALTSIVFSDQININKIIGFFFAIIAIYFLNK